MISCKLGLHKWRYTHGTPKERVCEYCGKAQMKTDSSYDSEYPGIGPFREYWKTLTKGSKQNV